MASLLNNILEFVTVLIAAFKGLSFGDKWVGRFIEAIQENTAELRKINESKTEDTRD